MDGRIVTLRYIVCGAILLVVSQGCSQNMYSSSTRMSRVTWRAYLDDRRYEQLTLEVLPREHLRLTRALKKIEIKGGVPRGQLKYRDVEVRTDREHRKVWFVETETSRIVATLDIETGATTGPDDTPPSWATPGGGIPLEGSK